MMRKAAVCTLFSMIFNTHSMELVQKKYAIRETINSPELLKNLVITSHHTKTSKWPSPAYRNDTRLQYPVFHFFPDKQNDTSSTAKYEYAAPSIDGMKLAYLVYNNHIRTTSLLVTYLTESFYLIQKDKAEGQEYIKVDDIQHAWVLNVSNETAAVAVDNSGKICASCEIQYAPSKKYSIKLRNITSSNEVILDTIPYSKLQQGLQLSPYIEIRFSADETELLVKLPYNNIYTYKIEKNS